MDTEVQGAIVVHARAGGDVGEFNGIEYLEHECAIEGEVEPLSGGLRA